MPIIETSLGQLCSEASDLNWDPGHWPKEFKGEDGAVWSFVRFTMEDGEIVAAKYVDLRKRILTVWND